MGKNLLEELDNDANLARLLGIDVHEAFAEKLVKGIAINNGSGHRETGVKGRVTGDKQVPPIFREVIAIQSNLGVDRKALADNFGVTREHIHNLHNGRVNTKAEIAKSGERDSDVELRKNLDNALGKVRDKALDRIMASLNFMDDDKLEHQSARELSQIGSNLSRILGTTMPKHEGPVQNNQFNTVIYAPETKPEHTYEVVEVD